MWSSLVLWLSLASLGTALICPDGQSCEEGRRCCHLPDGGYGCCPLSPDVLDALPMVHPGSLKDFSGKVCPNKAICPLEYSCITTPVGLYGCCPWEEGVSCDDGMHCCPRDFFCSADGRLCLRHPVFGLMNAIVCPDGESECPNESTCCEMPDHTWGCCPMPQATCCEDKVHCCPHSSTCDVAHGKCDSPAGEKPMWTKFAARKHSSWDDELGENEPEGDTPARVFCSDGSSCPDGTTCCKISDQKYGCCPIVDAVCCDDSKHCCPPETECDLIHNKCISETGTSPMLIKTPAHEPHFTKASTLKENVRDVKCDDTTSCQDGQTCCRLASGEWGCCPLPKAVCCSDHIHCCPSGTTCDTEHETCNSNGKSLPWVKKVQARGTSQNNDVQCDATTHCAQGETCCKTASQSWACCPLSQAVCCSDNVHCCPSGTTCDTEHETCITNNTSIPLVNKVHARQPSHSSDVQCNATTHCNDGETCCKTPSGSWACCPLPQAVCCSDHMHCCPSGYTCNVEQETCLQGSRAVPWQTKIPTRMMELKFPSLSLRCDDKVSCEENETCCKTPGGEWACCPLPQAVCCSDHVHCCPSGFTCNVEQETCTQGRLSVPWLIKNEAYKDDVAHVTDVPCDEAANCPEGHTCCKSKSGHWTCCPVPSAVCCSDHIHCCPNRYTCNLDQGTCVCGEDMVALFSKTPAYVKNLPRRSDIPCDDTFSCPDDNTCCRTTSGEWGCCPMPKAVCCSDHVHCCPNGYTCNVEQESCIQGGLSVPWFTKGAVDVDGPPENSLVRCDDEASCPDDSTCCKSESGTWACCPLAGAVCCSDHVHCCPNGYTCNVEQKSCTRGDEEIPFLLKTHTQVKEVPHIWGVPCDDVSSCPDGSTCCRSVSGSWECCPVEKAVCCSDHLHCCPDGYNCSVVQETCLRGDYSIPWSSKVPSQVNDTLQNWEVRCNDTSSCPDGNTCCRVASGDWGCCPILKAVCCEDHEHCCPSGYTCDATQGTCTKVDHSVPWITNKIASKKEVPRSEGVPCDDSHFCPDNCTCCRTTVGTWSCCPLLQAFCCENHEHCCPNGYTCDATQGTCIKIEKSLPWLPNTIASKKEVPRSEGIPCDDSHFCADNSTCCGTTVGNWSCCPLLQAFCCEDHEHCCPNGYTCDATQGTCAKVDHSVPWLPNKIASKKEVLQSETVPCDDSHFCADNSTCCGTTVGNWSCCPLLQAFCCEDHEHCCPNGYTCGATQGTCTKDNHSVPWLPNKIASKKEVIQSEAVPCDDSHFCTDNSTCCGTTVGNWSCCPLLQAFCCEDHEHCCPNGYTCDASQGTCTKVDNSVHWLPNKIASKKEVQRSETVPCDDSHFCTDNSTCCRTKAGTWTCCPLFQAFCCEDHEHCCPNGYTCEASQGTCTKVDNSVRWLPNKNASKKEVLRSEGVPCDDSHFCADNTTCCGTTVGTWSCCPLSKAVCCSDNVHCCPYGYTCNVADGLCTDGYGSVLSQTKSAASLKEEAVVACDETTSCPKDSTCCRFDPNAWACCPLPEAVCCIEGHRCCPSGYKCVGDSCEKEKALRWDKKSSMNLKMKMNFL